MEKVLEVADMLEVKGLSQIRSNSSIKKFMLPATSNATTSNAASSPPTLPGDNSAAGHVRSPPPDQSASNLTDDQMYCESQPRSSELENTGTWMRFSGTDVPETRAKEQSHSHVEDPATPTTEPPPSSHARTLHCQDSSSQEVQEESQVSGMDLSMAKNEPWSPKESSSTSDNKDSPSRKKRKLVSLP